MFFFSPYFCPLADPRLSGDAPQPQPQLDLIVWWRPTYSHSLSYARGRLIATASTVRGRPITAAALISPDCQLGGASG